jgi:ADP-ribose pyrophosphatase YjhB (NUDIX family)
MADPPAVPRWKRVAAGWLAWPPCGWLLRMSLRLAVPRHRIGAVVVLTDDRRRVLLVEHVFHPGDPWGLPGGWVRRDESPEQAVRRELLEETGLRAEIGPVVHLERISRPWHVGVAYAGAVRGGELRLGAELVDSRWVDPDDLPDGLSPFVHRAVAAAVAWYARQG